MEGANLPAVLSVLQSSLERKFEAEDAILSVGNGPLKLLRVRPKAVKSLAHQKLHAFPFEHVPLCWRRLYEEASLWQIAQIVNGLDTCSSVDDDINGKSDLVQRIVKLCDMALIMLQEGGTPLI